LKLRKGDNVVTVATDGGDRYPSVIEELKKRRPMRGDFEVKSRFESIYRGGEVADILDVRAPVQKERLFRQKEEVWTRFGYSLEYLDKMKSQSFWDAEYVKIRAVDELLCRLRCE
jgi:hypothetical protein